MLAENVYRAYLRAPNHRAKLRVEKWLAQLPSEDTDFPEHNIVAVQP